MTIRIIRVTERQSDDYDRFVKDLPNGHFRQGYAWGTVMGYEGDVFRLAVERSGSFVGALSIQRKKLPGTPFSILYAPRGPIANYDDDETIALLFEEARRIASDHMAIFLRIDPDAPDDDHSVRMQLQRHGFRYLLGKDWSSLNYPRLLMRIDTRPDEQELLKGMRKKHRQHINTLARKELVIEEIREARRLNAFYDLMTDLSVRKGFPLRPFEYYLRLWEAFGDDLRVLMASHSGKYIGGVLSLIHGNKCWYMHGASIAGKGNLHPAESLHWEIIRWARSRGCIYYDLGGTGTDYPPREDNPNYSLYHFKKGFGAKLHYLTGYYDLVFRKGTYTAFRALEDRALPQALDLVSRWKKRRHH